MGKDVFEMIRDFGKPGQDLRSAFPQRQLAAAALRRDVSRRRVHGHVPGDEGAAPGRLQRCGRARPCAAAGRRHRHPPRGHSVYASRTCGRFCAAPTKKSDSVYFLRLRASPNFGLRDKPSTAMRRNVPAPFFAKNGSTGFNAHRFHPVIVSDTLAWSLRVPRKSRLS